MVDWIQLLTEFSQGTLEETASSLIASGLIAGGAAGATVLWGLLRRRNVAFRLRVATLDELTRLRGRLEDYSPHAKVASIERMRSLSGIRADVYRVLERFDAVSRRFGPPEGYAIAFPLKKRLSERIAFGRAAIGDLQHDDLHTCAVRASWGMYIGFVWASSKLGQGFICRCLIDGLTVGKTTTKVVVARPTTPEALRFLTRRGFRLGTDRTRPPELFSIACHEGPYSFHPKQLLVQSI